MRTGILFLAAYVWAAALPLTGVAQDLTRPPAPPAREPGPSYIVRITEVQLRAPLDPHVTAADIVKSVDEWRRDGKLELIETVRLSTLAYEQSMVQFGRVVAVTVGVNTLPGGRPPARQMQAHNTGTKVQLTATPQEDKVLLKLSYRASRLRGEAPDDGPPDTATVFIETQVAAEPGQPQLLGGLTQDVSSPDGETTITLFLLVTIEK